MENSSPVPSLDSSEKPNINFMIFGIVIAIVYTVPVAAFFMAVVPVTALLASMSLGNGETFEAIFAVTFVVTITISFVVCGVIAFLSGRAAYRSANESGNIGDAVIATVVSFIVAFLGVWVFSFAGIFLVGVLYQPFATSDDAMIGTLPVGVAVGMVMTYIVAVASGALTHYILARRSAKQKNILKIQGGS